MSVQRMIRLISLLFIFLLTLEGRSYGSAFGNRKRGNSSSSVFSLFNSQQKSRFWSESVIRGDFDDLKLPALDKWVLSITPRQ
ncbi:unnamed protein product, partial [Ilex paraguariensis]